MSTVALALNLPTDLPLARLEVVITIAAGQSAPMYAFGILTRGSHRAATDDVHAVVCAIREAQ